MEGDYFIGKGKLNNGDLGFELPRGCRRLADGTVALPRQDKRLMDILNEHMDQLPNQLVWSPRTLSEEDWDSLKAIFKGRDCVIIAKGSSLNHLTAADIPAGAIVIAINEAIRKVETLELPSSQLCMLQQDASLKDSCRPIDDSTIILSSTNCAGWYSTHPRMFIFNNHEMVPHTMSVLKAGKLAMLSGAQHIYLLCFDAIMNGDLGYADCVGYDPGVWGSPKRFKDHGNRLKALLGKHPHTFKLPIALAESSSCSSEQLPDNPPEHHVSDDVQHPEHCTDKITSPSETES